MRFYLCPTVSLLFILAPLGCVPIARDDSPAPPTLKMRSTEPAVNRPSFSFADARIIDLTYAFDEQTIYWPTAQGFQLFKDFQGVFLDQQRAVISEGRQKSGGKGAQENGAGNGKKVI